MIDRSHRRLHFCLRPTTIGVAAIVSTGVFLVLPLVALICVIAGGFAYVGCVLAMMLLGLAGALLAIVGGIALIAGLLGGGRSEATGGGVVVGGIGLAGVALHGHWNKPVCAAGEAALAQCSEAAEFLTMQVFVGHHVYLWSWSALTISTTLALAILAVIGILRCETLLKARLHRIRYTCPVCHEQELPQFRCPSCSELASDLVPSAYGIFHARCAKCRTELPTLDLLGRLALPKVCGNRNCSADLTHSAIGKQRELHIGFVGAQSSGKTTLMIVSLWQVAQQIASKYGLQVEFADNQQKKTLHDFVARLASGVRLAKTASMPRPRAFNVALRNAKGPGGLIYLYDAAGEDFTEESRMSGHRFHRFVDGLVLVIDPFAEALSRPGKGGAIDRKAWSEVNPAATDVASVFQPFISRLEQQMNVSAKGLFPIPLAVVVTKMGAMSNAPWSSMAQERDVSAPPNSCHQGPSQPVSVGKKPSSPIREFLLDLGLANLVLGLETRFRKVAYFTTSAIEELPSPGRPLARRRAAVPLLWLIQQGGALPAAPPSTGGASTTAKAQKTPKQTSPNTKNRRASAAA